MVLRQYHKILFSPPETFQFLPTRTMQMASYKWSPINSSLQNQPKRQCWSEAVTKNLSLFRRSNKHAFQHDITNMWIRKYKKYQKFRHRIRQTRKTGFITTGAKQPSSEMRQTLSQQIYNFIMVVRISHVSHPCKNAFFNRIAITC